MESVIYWVGVIVSSLIVLYAIVYFLYLQLELKVDPKLPADAMPTLKPVPIPTKNEKLPFINWLFLSSK